MRVSPRACAISPIKSTPYGAILSIPIKFCSARPAATNYRPRSSSESRRGTGVSALVLLHRWLGVALCLLFAMWFTTGIVMHFVPFPALTEAERIAGLGVIDPAQVKSGPAAALRALRISDATRVRLLARFESPFYVIERGAAMTAVRATDLSS